MSKEVEFFTKESEDQRVSKDLILEECFELIKEEWSVTQLIELLNMLKNWTKNRERGKIFRQPSHGNQVDDHDPQVDLEINGFMVK